MSVLHRISSKAEMSWKYWKQFICLPSFSELNRDQVKLFIISREDLHAK